MCAVAVRIDERLRPGEPHTDLQQDRVCTLEDRRPQTRVMHAGLAGTKEVVNRAWASSGCNSRMGESPLAVP
jgi:hypothetical protein